MDDFRSIIGKLDMDHAIALLDNPDAAEGENSLRHLHSMLTATEYGRGRTFLQYNTYYSNEGAVMIDLHAHIPTGLTMAPARNDADMLRQAEEDGIGTMVATPITWWAQTLLPKGLAARFDDVARLIDKEGIKINLLLGNELFLDEYIFEAVESKCHTLAGTRYVLWAAHGDMRFTPKRCCTNSWPTGTGHTGAPERNAEVLDDPAVLIPFLEMGCITQVNSTSMTGIGGRRVQEVSRLLLMSGMGHLVASDCHSDKRRSPRLSAAYKLASEWLGRQKADRLFHNNPETVLRGGEIKADSPKLIHRDRGLQTE